jgi:hypothetical protein
VVLGFELRASYLLDSTLPPEPCLQSLSLTSKALEQQAQGEPMETGSGSQVNSLSYHVGISTPAMMEPKLKLERVCQAGCCWLTPVILAIQEAEMRRIVV